VYSVEPQAYQASLLIKLRRTLKASIPENSLCKSTKSPTHQLFSSCANSKALFARSQKPFRQDPLQVARSSGQNFGTLLTAVSSSSIVISIKLATLDGRKFISFDNEDLARMRSVDVATIGLGAGKKNSRLSS